MKEYSQRERQVEGRKNRGMRCNIEEEQLSVKRKMFDRNLETKREKERRKRRRRKVPLTPRLPLTSRDASRM